MPRDCAADNCITRASYGFHLSTIYCLDHSVGPVVEFPSNKFKICMKYRCNKVATHGYDNTEPLACEEHSVNGIKKDYRNKAGIKCGVMSCSIKARFGPSNLTSIFCDTCYREDSMIPVEPLQILDNCLENKCKNYALYGTESSGKASLCAEHSFGDIKDINNQHLICTHVDKHGERCNKRSTFGFIGSKLEKCKKHKDDDMVDLNSTKCIGEDADGTKCMTQPCFGIEKAEYCAKHKTEEMKDLRSVKCDFPGCETQAHYGFEYRQRCGQHKDDGMITIYKTQICQHQECFKFAGFGQVGSPRKYCVTHKSDDMVNVVSPRCEDPECNILASFGYDAKQRCASHYLDGMIDLTIRYCKKCEIVSVNRKYRPYCCNCHAEVNGLDPRNIRVMELAYTTKLKADLLKIKEDSIKQNLVKSIRMNQEIPEKVTRHRPDLYLEYEDRVILVEIDEDRHCHTYSYGEEDEERRNDSLKEGVGKPIFMIRLNGSTFAGQPSSFKKDQSGHLVPVPGEFESRYNLLLETVKKCELAPTEGFKTIKLFYD